MRLTMHSQKQVSPRSLNEHQVCSTTSSIAVFWTNGGECELPHIWGLAPGLDLSSCCGGSGDRQKPDQRRPPLDGWDCQLHPLTIELCDNAAWVRRRILQPEDPEVGEVNRREHRRETRVEKGQAAGFLIGGAGVPVNDETLKPSAPGACRYGGEFDPKVRKFWNAGRGSEVVLHREGIDLGNSRAVEADDIESEISRHECCVPRGRRADRGQGCRWSDIPRALRCKTNREVGRVSRCAVEHRNDCLHEGGFDELAFGLRCPSSVGADDRAVLLRERSLPSRRDPIEQRARAAG